MTEPDPPADDAPLEPSGIAQFVEQDRCPRYLKQRVEPGAEASARDWREAFGLMNIALLGDGREFEATQIEALAAHAHAVIGPSIESPSKAGQPDITIDETWAEDPQERTDQLRMAVETAKTLTATDDEIPYILLYQAPLDGTVGDQHVWGEADCIVLAPADAATEADSDTNTAADNEAESQPEATSPDPTITTNSHPATIPADEEVRADPDVVARVIDCKSAHDEKPGHRVQVAAYCALFEQTLAEGPASPACHIEASVLTQPRSVADGPLSPFALPTFRRAEWELYVTQLLGADGPVADALDDDLGDLPFAVDQNCNNCAFREACMTRAVEAPTAPASLATLGLDAGVQRALAEADVSSLADLTSLLPRQPDTAPTDDPPALDLPAAQQRALEEALPEPIHETALRAQAIRGELDPDYPSYDRPPALPGKDWVPLPDDRCHDWSNIDGAEPGQLVHVAVFVRPDTTIDRLAALGACVSAGAYEEYITIGEVIDAIPADPAVATDVEEDLLERFLTQVRDAIETVAAEVGDPAEAVVHCYTFSEHELEALAEGLERHIDAIPLAHAFRALLSLDPDGHTGRDQAMWSAVQPVLDEHFALQYPSRSLLTLAEQFVPTWTIDVFDPVDARGDAPPLRVLFREQFLNERVPYLAARPGIRLHLAREPLAEGPAVDAADTTSDSPRPDGWYPVRQRAGGQFPIEYIWAVTPRAPQETEPRLRPAVVEEWAIDDDHRDLYAQEINRFYYRTSNHDEPLQRADLEYLLERLGYALLRLVEAVPYKDTYHEKAPIDATSLSEFGLQVGGLPGAARDYLSMEYGSRRDEIEAHYRESLRQRVRTGRSVPFRCTDAEVTDGGALRVTGELAYDAIFADAATAAQIASQTRLRSDAGPGGGSWRVCTRLTTATTTPPADETASDEGDAGASDADGASDDPADATPASGSADASGGAAPPGGAAGGPSARGLTAADIDDPTTIKHSPPVLVTDLDHREGTVTLRTFPMRFRRHGSPFRVDHCGWTTPQASNLDDSAAPPADRPGYVAGRAPVHIEPSALFVLDPMVDDFGAPKADRALVPDTVSQNSLWAHLQSLQATGTQPPVQVCAPDTVDDICEAMAAADTCLTPNPSQAGVVRAVDRPLVPVQGPPGTGKTGGALAPALLVRAAARAENERSLFGLVVAPSHEAVDTALGDVADLLDAWRRAPETPDLETLDLVRVLPTGAPAADGRADAAASEVDVTYCNYHSAAGTDTLQDLVQGAITIGTLGDDTSATAADAGRTTTNADETATGETAPRDNASGAERDTDPETETKTGPQQCLVFATPATLYHVLGAIAEALPAIDGTSAPAAMRHAGGVADLVSLDEASMLDVPRLLLAGSALTPTGQTLLVGDHRQLATVTARDWTETRRKPLEKAQAHRSALEYVQWLNGTSTTSTSPGGSHPADGQSGPASGRSTDSTASAGTSRRPALRRCRGTKGACAGPVSSHQTARAPSAIARTSTVSRSQGTFGDPVEPAASAPADGGAGANAGEDNRGDDDGDGNRGGDESATETTGTDGTPDTAADGHDDEDHTEVQTTLPGIEGDASSGGDAR